MDTVAHHAYGSDATERPWRKHVESKVISLGDWNKLMYNLWLAFDGIKRAFVDEDPLYASWRKGM